MNSSKSEVMTSSNDDRDITIGGNVIKWVDRNRYLGHKLKSDFDNQNTDLKSWLDLHDE